MKREARTERKANCSDRNAIKLFLLAVRIVTDGVVRVTPALNTMMRKRIPAFSYDY